MPTIIILKGAKLIFNPNLSVYILPSENTTSIQFLTKSFFQNSI